MSKEYLSITVREKVERSIMVQIGNGISEEDAKMLLELNKEETEFDFGTEAHGIIDSIMPYDISDSLGFYDVEIKKEK